MSVKISTRVWEYSNQSSSDLLLLLAIADHADDDGICWPGVERLAFKTRCSERQARRNVAKLVSRGEVFIGQGKGRGNTNLHFIVIGLTTDKIEGVLHTRFGINKQDAELLTEGIVKKQKEYRDLLKPVTGDTTKPVTGDTTKPVTGDTENLSPVTLKPDTGDIENLSPVTLKPDIAMSPEPLEPLLESLEEDGININSSLSETEIWQQTQAHILQQSSVTRATFDQCILPVEALPRRNGIFRLAFTSQPHPKLVEKIIKPALLSLDTTIEEIEVIVK